MRHARRTLALAILAALLGLTVTAGSAAAGGFVVEKAPQKTSGGSTLRIGWFYTDEEYTGEHGGRLTLKWPGCVKAGGYYVDFPKGGHVYPFREPPAPKQYARFTLFNGVFVSQVYVGASAKPGAATLKLTCLNGKKHPIGTGNLKETFVRKPMKFGANDIPQTLLVPDLFQGFTSDPSYAGITLPSCSEPGITSIKITTDALAADPVTGLRSVTLGRENPSSSEDGGFFQAPLTGAPDMPPGSYPISISCGSGLIGTGTIRLQPPLPPL